MEHEQIHDKGRTNRGSLLAAPGASQDCTPITLHFALSNAFAWLRRGIIDDKHGRRFLCVVLAVLLLAFSLQPFIEARVNDDIQRQRVELTDNKGQYGGVSLPARGCAETDIQQPGTQGTTSTSFYNCRVGAVDSRFNYNSTCVVLSLNDFDIRCMCSNASLGAGGLEYPNSHFQVATPRGLNAPLFSTAGLGFTAFKLFWKCHDVLGNKVPAWLMKKADGVSTPILKKSCQQLVRYVIVPLYMACLGMFGITVAPTAVNEFTVALENNTYEACVVAEYATDPLDAALLSMDTLQFEFESGIAASEALNVLPSYTRMNLVNIAEKDVTLMGEVAPSWIDNLNDVIATTFATGQLNLTLGAWLSDSGFINWLGEIFNGSSYTDSPAYTSSGVFKVGNYQAQILKSCPDSSAFSKNVNSDNWIFYNFTRSKVSSSSSWQNFSYRVLSLVNPSDTVYVVLDGARGHGHYNGGTAFRPSDEGSFSYQLYSEHGFLQDTLYNGNSSSGGAGYIYPDPVIGGSGVPNTDYYNEDGFIVRSEDGLVGSGLVDPNYGAKLDLDSFSCLGNNARFHFFTRSQFRSWLTTDDGSLLTWQQFVQRGMTTKEKPSGTLDSWLDSVSSILRSILEDGVSIIGKNAQLGEDGNIIDPGTVNITPYQPAFNPDIVPDIPQQPFDSWQETLDGVQGIAVSPSVPDDETQKPIVSGEDEPVNQPGSTVKDELTGEKPTPYNPPSTPSLPAKVQALGSDVSDKFPFCLPGDVLAVARAFDVEGQAPNFDWPIYNPITGKNWVIHVSLVQFEPVAIVTRYAMDVILLLLTILLASRYYGLLAEFGGK